MSTEPNWQKNPLSTVWDDLLADISSVNQWPEKQQAIRQRFLALIKDQAAPSSPVENDLRIEKEWDADDFHIQYVSYIVEERENERAYAYIGIPFGEAPADGYPAVVCLQGTTNWGAGRTLGILPEDNDPHVHLLASAPGGDYARQLVRRGFITISPEYFCAATRIPSEGPFDTAAFYRKHPNWSAVGKYIYDSVIATNMLCDRGDVDATKIGVTGHSLGAQGSIWLAAYDQRIQCVVPNCAAMTFREYEDPLQWSRDYWHIYFPQLREQFLADEIVQCDFHEMMALIAPRPLFEIFALNDGDQHCQNHRVLLHLKLRELYRLQENEKGHSFTVTGDGHTLPDLTQQSMLAWMERWLQADGKALGLKEFHATAKP